MLLLAGDRAPMEHDLPDTYEALHNGHIDLSTGHYVREDEDLVVRGTPALILRRAYIFDFTHRIEHRAVVQTDTKRSDGTWTTDTFKDRYVTAEAWGAEACSPCLGRTSATRRQTPSQR